MKKYIDIYKFWGTHNLSMRHAVASPHFLIMKILHGFLFHLDTPGLCSKNATQAIDGTMSFEMVNRFATLALCQGNVSWRQSQTSSVSAGVDVVVCHMWGRDTLLLMGCWCLGCSRLPFRLGFTDLRDFSDISNLCLGGCLRFRPGSCFPFGTCFLLGCCCLPLGRCLALSICTSTSGLCGL